MKHQQIRHIQTYKTIFYKREETNGGKVWKCDRCPDINIQRTNRKKTHYDNDVRGYSISHRGPIEIKKLGTAMIVTKEVLEIKM